MQAIVVHGPGDVRVESRPDPSPGPGEVVVAMEWGGVCGSDISYARHGYSGTAVLRQPLVLGHEVAGRIAVLGAGVSGCAVGDAVTVHLASPGGRYFGSAAVDPHEDGGFSTYRVVRVDQLRALPGQLTTRVAALAEPLAVALHAVDRLGSVRDQTVFVNGAGSIGSLVVAALKARGAARVLSADVNPDALAMASALGADEVFDARAGLPGDIPLVVEASGVAAALGAVLRATARGGTVVQVGNLPITPTPAALGDLVSREITWIGSYRFVDEITEAVALLADGLDVTPLIAGEFDLADAAAALAAAATTAGKVLLRLS